MKEREKIRCVLQKIDECNYSSISMMNFLIWSVQSEGAARVSGEDPSLLERHWTKIPARPALLHAAEHSCEYMMPGAAAATLRLEGTANRITKILTQRHWDNTNNIYLWNRLCEKNNRIVQGVLIGCCSWSQKYSQCSQLAFSKCVLQMRWWQVIRSGGGYISIDK